MQRCSCGAANPDQARFCESCGSPLGKLRCPACDAELPPNARFCTECGRAVMAEPAPAPASQPATRAEPWGMWSTFQPINSVSDAKDMADIGARGCMFAAMVLLLFGFIQWHGMPVLRGWEAFAKTMRGPSYNLYLGAAAAACAFGFHRRWLGAAYASFGLFALVILFNIVVPPEDYGVQLWLGWFVSIGLLAMWLSALVAGLRGCRALLAFRVAEKPSL